MLRIFVAVRFAITGQLGILNPLQLFIQAMERSLRYLRKHYLKHCHDEMSASSRQWGAKSPRFF